MSRLLPIGVLACLFGLDGLVFRTGFYIRILEPDTDPGLMMSFIMREEARVRSSSALQVIALGHSRMDFDTSLANSLRTGCEFSSIAVPGTLPRVWYYMLRETDPDARKYDAIIIPAEDYDDEDWEDFSRRRSDIGFAGPLLKPAEIPGFILSYPDWEGRRLAAASCMLNGVALRGDPSAGVSRTPFASRPQASSKPARST